jgi:hypothetical protein
MLTPETLNQGKPVELLTVCPLPGPESYLAVIEVNILPFKFKQFATPGRNMQ